MESKVLKWFESEIENLKKEDKVLVLQDSNDDLSEHFSKIVKDKIGSKPVVASFKTQDFPPNNYDLIIAIPSSPKIDEQFLDSLLNTLKFSSPLLIITKSSDAVSKFKSELKFSGFISIEVKESDISTTSSTHAITITSCKRPSYKLDGHSKETAVEESKNLTSAQIWKLSANDMLDDDIIDSDLVLEPADLVKPSSDSLVAPKCGTESANQKKRACKNCTCGLAEELAGEKEVATQKELPKSSCGSCYLGDAFRCASCPYMGMPAFKPGQKVQLPPSSG